MEFRKEQERIHQRFGGQTLKNFKVTWIVGICIILINRIMLEFEHYLILSTQSFSSLADYNMLQSDTKYTVIT